jgi:tetratricopeptide (TPR) repeat protein
LWKESLTHLAVVLASQARPIDLFVRGVANAELGHWNEALDDFSKAVSLGIDDEQLEYYVALAHLATKDLNGYQEVCARLRQRLQQTNCAPTVNLVGWCCALSPSTEGALPGELILQAIARVKRAPGKSSPGYFYWDGPSAETYLTVLGSTMGACLYRQGHFDEATKYLRGSERDDEPDALRCLYMAMALYRLNQQEEARDWLQKAVKAKDDGNTSVAQQIYGHPNWVVPLEYDILRREAEALIQPQQ